MGKDSLAKTRLNTPSLTPLTTRWQQVLEPEKCESWTWMKWEELKGMAESEGEESEKLFLPLRNLIKQRPELDPRDVLEV